MKISKAILALVCTIPLVLTACSSGDSTDTGATADGDSTAASGDPIIIGFAADLSSTYAYYDQPMLEGAQLAVDEINETGGVLGRPLDLKVVDIRNDPAEATKAVQEMIDEGAVYLIGSTGDVIAAEGAIACEAGVPISTGDGTAPTLVDDIGECAFQVLMNDTIQGATAAEYALAQGYKTAFLLGSPEYAYTANLPGYFSEVFTAGGGEIVGETSFTIGAGDFSAVVTKIANADPAPDVIFTPIFVPDTPVFMRQLRQAGVTLPVISTDGNLDPSLADAGADAIDGMVFTAPVCTSDGNEDIAAFYETYNARNGSDPSSAVAALGYDEINILAQTIETAGASDSASIMAGLANAQYDGITGRTEMNPETRRANKPAAMILMEGTNFTCLPAPAFPSLVPAP
jgi:branched-chain amino acid transport system substrate-binding protein